MKILQLLFNIITTTMKVKWKAFGMIAYTKILICAKSVYRLLLLLKYIFVFIKIHFLTSCLPFSVNGEFQRLNYSSSDSGYL